MSAQTIKNLGGALLFSGDYASFKAALADAVRLGIDLTGADLSNQDLTAINLNGARLAGAKFDGSDLSNTSMERANAMNASMIGVGLHNTHTLTANLVGAVIRHERH